MQIFLIIILSIVGIIFFINSYLTIIHLVKALWYENKKDYKECCYDFAASFYYSKGTIILIPLIYIICSLKIRNILQKYGPIKKIDLIQPIESKPPFDGCEAHVINEIVETFEKISKHMKNNPLIEKLPIRQQGELCISVFQEKEPVQYFAEFTRRIAQGPTMEFKLLHKGTSVENKIASSLGSSISIQQIPEVLQKLKGTQFSLRCESQLSKIPIEIFFNLYDDNIDLSCPDYLEKQVMSILLDKIH